MKKTVSVVCWMLFSVFLCTTTYHLLLRTCILYSMNETKPYLSIAVGETSTVINYIVDGEYVVSHTHRLGYKNLEADGMNVIAGSKFVDGILYTLEFISLYDRIPTDFRISSQRYVRWIGKVIEDTSYTQFYTGGSPINVTLENVTDSPLSYARHSQTIQSFKL